ncbi:major facilitator superfamily domain-containing protein [Mucor mucedo]|uniref:major facilitator superfamily domain-containing protein n=1 Tax=Mucor mucedo TaxID=29922 RepID=UPI00221F463E|nr:major facilitator superfamily domain-containing protein [Mucor mucedo]KAI7897330.1 major facilitator superfamily domain-containing protein [Mucor mucedo]
MLHSDKKSVSSINQEEYGAVKRPSYFIPAALVTTLFFLWGFSYGLLDTLNKHFRNVLGISTTMSTFMQVAYFGAYLVFCIPASYICKKIGYKKTIIFGLFLYVIGALCFYPSAVYLSFGGFVGSLFIIACGICTLETCANSYITIVGDRKNASLRINIAQSFNGIASVLAPIVASFAFFGGESEDDVVGGSLESVKWTYVGVAGGVFFIGVLFCFAHIPEIDEEAVMLAESKETGEIVRRASLYSPHLVLGAISQFLYVGGQVGVASMFLFYASDVGHISDSKGSILLSVALGCFTIGRFVGIGLLKKFRPEHLLAAFSLGAIITMVFIIAMKTPGTTYALLVLMFFESIIFPTIFSLGTKDLGRNHKRGSAFIIMGTAGGACLPPIQAVVHDHTNVNISFIVPLIAFVFVFGYAIIGHTWIKYVNEPLADTSSINQETFEDKLVVVKTENVRQ